MADRAFERMFTEAAAREAAAEAERATRRPPDKRTAAEEEEAALRKAADPMTVADAIKRILLAWKDKDYFRLLQLPQPEADALGRPAWSGTAGDVSRAYRRLSILVHPDKFMGQDEKLAEAREAFEALNEAHRMLRDPSSLEQVLAKEADAARARRQKREAEATLEERVVLNAQQKEAVRELTRKEGENFQAQLQRQQQERLEAAKRKREALDRARRRSDSGNEAADSEDEREKERAAERVRQRQKEEEAAANGDEEAAAARRRQNAAKRRRVKQQQQT